MHTDHVTALAISLLDILAETVKRLVRDVDRLTEWRRGVEAQLAGVLWICQYCGAPQTTPSILWDSVKYTLLCESCHYQQNYPGWITQFDQDPL